MPAQLEFPDVVWKEGQRRLAVEVSIDFLPSEYEGNWLGVVHSYIADWIQKKSFEKKATLWMWATPSVNLVSRHPQYPAPSLSEFIIQFGLSDELMSNLAHHLAAKFADQAAATEMLTARRDDGWTPICHVEQGRAWVKVDADLWEPFIAPHERRHSPSKG